MWNLDAGSDLTALYDKGLYLDDGETVDDLLKIPDFDQLVLLPDSRKVEMMQ